MARKRSAYRRRPMTRPMLVNRGVGEAKVEIDERMAVEAFAGGWAGPSHFDYLADMRDCLALAAAYRKDQGASDMSKAALVALDNIRQRYIETARFGVTGDELHVLRIFCDTYRDFWLRQPVELYEAAIENLQQLRMSGAMTVNVETMRG